MHSILWLTVRFVAVLLAVARGPRNNKTNDDDKIKLMEVRKKISGRFASNLPLYTMSFIIYESISLETMYYFCVHCILTLVILKRQSFI